MKHLFFLVIFFGISCLLFSQPTDSLINELSEATDSVKVDIYNQVAWDLRNTEPKKGIEYLEKSIKLADSIQYYYGMSVAFAFLGVEYRNIGNYSGALIAYTDALRTSEKHQFKDRLAYNYGNLGNLYLYLKMYDDALLCIYLSDSIGKSLLKDNETEATQILAYSSTNFARIYFKLKKYDSSLYYFNLSAKYWKKLNRDDKIGWVIVEKSEVYLRKGEYNKTRKLLDSSKIFLDINKDYTYGIYYYQISSQLYFEINQQDLALQELDSAKFYANKINSKNDLQIIHLLRSQYYAKMGLFEKAYEEKTEAYNLHTEIYNYELSQNIMMVKYRDDQLTSENKILKLKNSLALKELRNKQQRIVIILILTILIILLISFITIYKINRKLKKTNSVLNKKSFEINEQNTELIAQREELLIQQDIINEQKGFIIEHDRMLQDNISYASSIKRALLPNKETIDQYFENFIIYVPRDIISGDFYWFCDDNPNYNYFIVGDCTGHGVSGAILSVIAMYLFKNVIIERNIEETIEILNQVNNQFDNLLHKRVTKNIDGFDIALLRFNKKNTDEITFAGAKLSIYIYFPTENELKKYTGVRRSIGNSLLKLTSKKVNFESEQIKFYDDCIIYLYSDGFVDQNTTDGRRYGSIRFEKFLKSISLQSVEKQKKSLIEELTSYMKNVYQRDDITILGLKRKKNNINH